MKVRFLKSTVADCAHYKAGDVAEVSDSSARFLFSVGKAEVAVDEPKPKRKAKKSPVNRQVDDFEVR